ncbi:MAG: urea ABC transporter ATP-binding protein UrtD [Armatimonadetes bacterium]|nr:urea ABC transporter ATP-binding protein UrtD [Armatimonadota bacterium]MDW8153308.1 urea ABC transporter ATP-binding protein UrtD [Armatimonadota bacterium]
MSREFLSVQGITVLYEGFRALNEVHLRLHPGEVRVLVGPNGAGKSTLLDVIAGRVRPASGRILLDGRDITRCSERERARLGIQRKFQTPSVLEELTVEENVRLAIRAAEGWTRLVARPAPEVGGVVESVLRTVGLDSKRHLRAGALSHGEKQWLEIAMVTAAGPRLLLLDEPTAGMTRGETEQTAELVRALGERYTVLVVEHDMEFVGMLRAPVTVLHMGQVLREGSLEEIRSDPEVRAVYLGRVEARC